MDKQRIEHGADRATEQQAEETIELFSGKLDRATRCAAETRERAEEQLENSAARAADRAEKTASDAAERPRGKVSK